MGEARRRAEHGLISVLIPERGRPEMLWKLVDSLVATAGGDPGVEIIVQIDDDDPAWPQNPLLPAGQTVRYIRKPKPPTLGEKLNQLAKEARGEFLWFVSDDLEMLTHGWPAKFREAAAKLPSGIGVCYPRDPSHPNHAAYWLITRRMYETVGFFAPPWFPYWFVDTWWDEIGVLTDRKVEIDADLKPQGIGRGETIGGRPDLQFWARFFEDTRPLRVRDTIMLLGGPVNVTGRPLNQAEQAWINQHMPGINQRLQICAQRSAHLHTQAFLERWGTSGATDPQVKAIAENLLAQVRAQAPRKVRVAITVPSGRSWEAQTAAAVAAMTGFSAQSGVDLAFINVQSSMISHGRNSSVEIALNQMCDYILWVDSDMQFPPNALIRLLQHNKDIVGATYNKRVPPYETLGKLIEPPSPGEVMTGLHESYFLPSGMLLVKTNVYRKMMFPWYKEGSRANVASGFERWWLAMCEDFGEAPPPEVSASVQGTFFAEWIERNYKLSEFGDDPMILSEDIFFCRKARRLGYQVWCDIDLTYDMIHLGVLPVTCGKPGEPGSERGALQPASLAVHPAAPQVVQQVAAAA